MTKENRIKLIKLHESIEKQIRRLYEEYPKCNISDKPLERDYPIE